LRSLAREAVAGRAAVESALEAREPLRIALVRAGATDETLTRLLERLDAHGVRVRLVGDRELARLCPDPDVDVLAMRGPTPAATLAETMARPGAVWLLTGTAYPGNAGFAIRTAEVSGAAGAVIDAAFERPDRREALRASMRADRYMPVHFAPADETFTRARAADRRVVAIETSGTKPPWECDLCGPVLLVAGGEATGIPAPLLARCDDVVRLPMRGFLRSYNVQAAVAAVAAERLRQEAQGGR